MASYYTKLQIKLTPDSLLSIYNRWNFLYNFVYKLRYFQNCIAYNYYVPQLRPLILDLRLVRCTGLGSKKMFTGRSQHRIVNTILGHRLYLVYVLSSDKSH